MSSNDAAHRCAHVRPVSPIAFPDRRPETVLLRRSQRHSHMCIGLTQMLRTAVSVVVDAPRSRSGSSPNSSSSSSLAARIGSVAADKLVYFRANDPTCFIEPDACVKLGPVVIEDVHSWKTWERGAPDVAFEILSPSDSGEAWSLDEKVERYNELGVRELVVFDVDHPPGHRLRVWDRVDGDFVERIVEDERTPCLTLDGFSLAVDRMIIDRDAEYPACLRLVRDVDNTFVPTTHEATIAAAEAHRAADQALQDKEAAEQAKAEASMAGAQSQRAKAQARGDAEAASRLAELEAARARTRSDR